MSIEITRLKERRVEMVQRMHEIVERCEKEDRARNAEESQQWETCGDAIIDLDMRIADGIRANELLASQPAPDPAPGQPAPLAKPLEPEVDKKEVFKRAFGAWLRSTEPGMSGLSPEHRAAMQAHYQPATAEERAQGVATGGAGGFTVPEEMSRTITESLLAFSGIRNVATVLSTAGGGTLNFPGNDDTANVGVILAENTVDTEQDFTFSELSLSSFKYTSKIVRVSVELMQDEEVGLESYIARQLGTRLGRATAAHYATGAGTTEPFGLMTDAANGATTAINSAITWDELLDLKHSVDPAYRTGPSVRWAWNDSTLKAIKQLQDSQNRPLWIPQLAASAPATFDGDQYIIDQGIASIATTARVVAYGDMSSYMIRDVMGITLARLVERYADFHQVGFVAIMRTDARSLNVNAVKHLDMAV